MAHLLIGPCRPPQMLGPVANYEVCSEKPDPPLPQCDAAQPLVLDVLGHARL